MALQHLKTNKFPCGVWFGDFFPIHITKGKNYTGHMLTKYIIPAIFIGDNIVGVATCKIP